MKICTGIIILSFISCISPLIMVFGQDQGSRFNSQERLFELSDSLGKASDSLKKAAVKKAAIQGIPLRRVLGDGRIMELQYFENSLPVYYETNNSVVAVTLGTNALHPGGSLGVELTGRNIPVGVWDSGPVDSLHYEFGGRVKIRDLHGSPSEHATHVAGTIGAFGIVPEARGMAYEAQIESYNWTDALAEVAAAAAGGLLISNHSYGIALGWSWDNNRWVWRGDPTKTYESRFGFYTTTSVILDEIAFNAPYYLSVWSAGNARTGTGDGTRNPNGPFDCIGPEKVAKNVLAIGSVFKIPGGYKNPPDVVMTTYSSWGPSDDGRVKPDLVTAGQSVFSTIPNHSYGVKSGTSMASPAASGSLLLLQELYKQKTGKFMKAATLKGLAIHTANEAGQNQGPDYSFGWGLLNTKRAAEVILNMNSVNHRIEEMTLNQGEKISVRFWADGTMPITATISWTDPPGTPPPVSNNPPDLMLVNDLDIRIKDEAGNIYYPWILDPSAPALPATKGDNFRDNLEKIFIVNPAPRPYTIEITHKNNLNAGRQDFSLILSTSALEEDTAEILYWIGNDGNWDDPQEWSFSSGGSPAGTTPGLLTHVIIDENSFSGQNQVITLNSKSYCRSFSWLSNDNATLNFNGNQLSIDGSIMIRDNLMLSGESLIHFLGEALTNNKIVIQNQLESDFEFILRGNQNSNWEIFNTVNIRKIEHVSGNLIMKNSLYGLKEYTVKGLQPKILDISNSVFSELSSFDIANPSLELFDDNSKLVFKAPGIDTPALLIAGNRQLPYIKSSSGQLSITGNTAIDSLFNMDIVYLQGNNQIKYLHLSANSETILEGGSKQVVDSLVIISGAGNFAEIKSTNDTVASIQIDRHRKYCFNYLIIRNVNAPGLATMVAGGNSIVHNSPGWYNKACEAVLFPDFKFSFNCVHSQTRFTDLSSGNIISWQWDFGSPSPGISLSNDRNPVFTYPQLGEHRVVLTINDTEGNKSYSQIIQITPNTLPENTILISGQNFFSVQVAPFYQWFLNKTPITGAYERIFTNRQNLSGEFQVMTSDNVCNRMSAPVITAIPQIEENKRHFILYPNPVTDKLFIEPLQNESNQIIIEVFDITGKTLAVKYFESAEMRPLEIDFSRFLNGIYIIRLTDKFNSFSTKVIKK